MHVLHSVTNEEIKCDMTNAALIGLFSFDDHYDLESLSPLFPSGISPPPPVWHVTTLSRFSSITYYRVFTLLRLWSSGGSSVAGGNIGSRAHVSAIRVSQSNHL